MLFMTTVCDGTEYVKRKRRRPANTATGALQTRKVFGDNVVKELAIPSFIDLYNHWMNGVDLADQFRHYYTIQRQHKQTWKPLWHFLLDTANSNAYKLSSPTPS